MQKEITKKTAHLQRVYRTQLILNILLLIIASIIPAEKIIAAEDQVTLQSLLILYTLGMIPFTLKAFQRQIRRISLHLSLNEKINQYARLFHLRWIILGSVVWFNLIAYLYSDVRSHLLLALIGTISLFFCNTSDQAVAKDLQINPDSDENITSESTNKV